MSESMPSEIDAIVNNLNELERVTLSLEKDIKKRNEIFRQDMEEMDRIKQTVLSKVTKKPKSR